MTLRASGLMTTIALVGGYSWDELLEQASDDSEDGRANDDEGGAGREDQQLHEVGSRGPEAAPLRERWRGAELSVRSRR